MTASYIIAAAVVAICWTYPVRAWWQLHRADMEQDEVDMRSRDHSASDVWSVHVMTVVHWRRREAAWLRENSTLLRVLASIRGRT